MNNCIHNEELDDKGNDLLNKTNELFSFMETQKNLQLQVINLIKDVQPNCSPNYNMANSLNQTIKSLTDEIKESLKSQKSIEYQLISCLTKSKGSQHKECNHGNTNLNQTIRSLTEEIRNSIISQKAIESGIHNYVKQNKIPIIKSDPISSEKVNSNFKIPECKTIPIQDKKYHNIPVISTPLSPVNDLADNQPCSHIKHNKNIPMIGGFSSLRNDFSAISKPSIFIYTVDNFSYKINRSIEEWSELFYTSHIGYRMKVKLGFETDHLGIYVKLVVGDYDDLMAWPFTNEIEFVLLNQIDECDNISRILKPQPYDCDEQGYWDRPSSNEHCDKEGWGLSDFISLEVIKGPYGDYLSDFNRNNKLYIKVKLVSQ